MSTPINRAIMLVVIVYGVAGCDGSNRASPSSIPTTPTPTSAATPISVASIVPDSGPTWRDTTVEIKGTGFLPSSRVSFGGVPASNVGVINGETIWARSPILDAETVDVIVTNLAGQAATLARAFTFVPIPFPTLTMSASAVAPGGALTVSWATEAAGSGDYVALFAIGASSEEASIWHYQTYGARSGTAALAAPNQPGRYEFKYLPDDGHVDFAHSNPLTVGHP